MERKYIAPALLAVGVVLGLIGLFFDTTVPVDILSETFGGRRVVNLDLMEQRRTILMLAGLAILVGSIIMGFDSLRQPANGGGEKRRPIDTRACPFCAEEIKIAAKVCKHCNRDVPAADIDKPEAVLEEEQKGNTYAADSPEYQRAKANANRNLVIGLGIAFVFIVLVLLSPG